MITFTNIGNHGRFGNIMFQYAAVKSLANKLNCLPKFPPELFDKIHHGQKCLINCFKLNCSFYSNDELINLNNFNEQYFCNGGHYTNEFWNCKENTNLSGHFESELYFENIIDGIKKEYELKDEYKKYVVEYIENIKQKYPEHEIIGIHIRRGDYLNPQNGAEFITTTDYNKNYLNKALQEFTDNKKKVFIVFTGGSLEENNNNSNDILWCKNNITEIIKDNIILFSENHSTIQDFGLMTLCDHLILNSSSTIGWWAAYLNINVNKKIIVPKGLGFKNDDTYWHSSYIQITY